MRLSQSFKTACLACVWVGVPLLVAACSSSGDGTGSGGSTSSSIASGAGGASSGSSISSSSAGGGDGGASSGGGSAGGGTGGGSSADCSRLPLCDGFEGAAVGGPPGAATWAVVSPNCSGTGKITVDETQAHSGTKSIKVSGGGSYCDHVFMANTSAMAEIGAVVYGRYFVRFTNALGDGHVTFVTMKDTTDNGKDLRMGGQSKIFMWNRESDDATLPALSPAGVAQSLQPPTQKWLCVEFMVSEATGFMLTWVDGTEIEGLHLDDMPTPDVDQQWLNKSGWKPSLTDFKLGWESYAGQTMTLWFDDVALGGERIGCD